MRLAIALILSMSVLCATPTIAQQEVADTAVTTCEDTNVSTETDLACRSAVDQFLAIVNGTPDSAQQIGDLAASLASGLENGRVTQRPICIRIGREIDRLSGATPDIEQSELLRGISQAVSECRVVATSAIIPLPASGNGPNA